MNDQNQQHLVDLEISWCKVLTAATRIDDRRLSVIFDELLDELELLRLSCELKVIGSVRGHNDRVQRLAELIN